MKRTSQNSDNHPASQLAALLQALPASPSAREIHRLRVSIKRTRAWLKLCHAVTDSTPSYPQLVTSLRDLSHALSAQRDRDVAVQTLTKLVARYPGKKTQHLGDVLSQLIAQDLDSPPDITSLDSCIAQIRELLPTFTCLALPRQPQVAVIERRFAKMCKAGERALGSATCMDLHAWRKRVKTLFYQVEMVADALPGQNRIQLRLDKLGRCLGKIHDLCVLEAMLEDKLALLQPPLTATPVFKRIRRERHRLIAFCYKHYHRLCT
ncbi:MAG: CHAD domain-containing protein [Gammaproteobacteria bacterium]